MEKGKDKDLMRGSYFTEQRFSEVLDLCVLAIRKFAYLRIASSGCQMEVGVGHECSIRLFIHYWENCELVKSYFIDFSPWSEDDMNVAFNKLSECVKAETTEEFLQMIGERFD